MDTIVEVSEENDTTEELEDAAGKDSKKQSKGDADKIEILEKKPKKRVSGPVSLDITDDFSLNSPTLSETNENFTFKENHGQGQNVKVGTKLEETKLYIPNPSTTRSQGGGDSDYKSSSLESIQSLKKSSTSNDSNYFDFPEIETFEKRDVIWDRQSNKGSSPFDLVKADIVNNDKRRLKTVPAKKGGPAENSDLKSFGPKFDKPELSVKVDEGSSSDEGIGIIDGHSPKTTEEIQNTLNLQKEKNKSTRRSTEAAKRACTDPGRMYIKNEMKVTKQKPKTLPNIRTRTDSPALSPRPYKPRTPEINILPNENIAQDTGDTRCETPGHSVKMMAQFWEDFRKQVEEERSKTSPSIRFVGFVG